MNSINNILIKVNVLMLATNKIQGWQRTFWFWTGFLFFHFPGFYHPLSWVELLLAPNQTILEGAHKDPNDCRHEIQSRWLWCIIWFLPLDLKIPKKKKKFLVNFFKTLVTVFYQIFFIAKVMQIIYFKTQLYDKENHI